MKLGSHNSMTYLPPKKWWLYPFRFIAKCQAVPIHEQYERYGARLFDFRISFTEDGIPEFRHGLMAFKGNVEDYFRYLNNYDVKVRLLLEEYRNDDNDVNEYLFKKYCEKWEKEYPNIKFCGGQRKWDWKEIYHFGNKFDSEDKYSSVVGNKLDDLWPWLYAKLNNKKNIEKGTDKEFLLIDFINER